LTFLSGRRINGVGQKTRLQIDQDRATTGVTTI